MLTDQAKKWIAEQKKLTADKDMEEMSCRWFFRDPVRPEPTCRDFFFTPADGFITLQGRFDTDADMVDVKGAEITLNTLLGPHEIDQPALAIAVFMSFLDVHINRAPTECCITRHQVPPVRTANVPMLWTERGILKDLRIKPASMGFMAENERIVNEIFCAPLKYRYFVVQIADSDVNYIVPLKPGDVTWYNQNERFGQIRWGSMCVLVLPLDERFKFTPLCQVGDHVECCIDPLVRVDRH